MDIQPGKLAGRSVWYTILLCLVLVSQQDIQPDKHSPGSKDPLSPQTGIFLWVIEYTLSLLSYLSVGQFLLGHTNTARRTERRRNKTLFRNFGRNWGYQWGTPMLQWQATDLNEHDTASYQHSICCILYDHEFRAVLLIWYLAGNGYLARNGIKFHSMQFVSTS
jgi:hypothetical protein